MRPLLLLQFPSHPFAFACVCVCVSVWSYANNNGAKRSLKRNQKSKGGGGLTNGRVREGGGRARRLFWPAYVLGKGVCKGFSLIPISLP